MDNNILFVYGSLRRGDYNHARTGLGGATYLGTNLVPNFILRHNGCYPAAFEDGDPDLSVVVDVYDVTNYDMTWIDRMEEGAGYDKQEVMALDGTRGMMYIMPAGDEDMFPYPVTHSYAVYDWMEFQKKEVA